MWCCTCRCPDGPPEDAAHRDLDVARFRQDAIAGEPFESSSGPSRDRPVALWSNKGCVSEAMLAVARRLTPFTIFWPIC
jgi:hypothetical protein